MGFEFGLRTAGDWLMGQQYISELFHRHCTLVKIYQASFNILVGMFQANRRVQVPNGRAVYMDDPADLCSMPS